MRASSRHCISSILLLILALLSRSTAYADGLIVIDRWPLERRLPVVPGHELTPLEVREHHVTVSIKDQVASTQVDQTFFNPFNLRLEGTYIFPIPKNARIDKFSMEINGKMTDAEMLDAEKAKQIYEDIVRKMKDPALLEYAGQGMFKLRIFPIEPQSEKRIRLSYTELLSQESGLVHYRYPLNTEKFSSTPLKSLSLKVSLDSQQPLKSVYSPTHSVEVRRSSDKQATVGYEASNVKPDTDFELFFAPDSSAGVGLSMLAYHDGSDTEGGYFLLLASPPTELAADKVQKKDVAFVLDTSGSMADGNKLQQAKKALQFCLKNLNSGDRFEIVRFSTESEALFNRLAEADEASIAKAEQFLNSLKPSGGTAIEEALAKAFEIGKQAGGKDRPYFVVFLTDGMPTVGETNEDRLLGSVFKKAGERTPRVFSFGVGTDVNTHLLDKLTEQTKAASQYVRPQEDLELKVSSFYNKINNPVLSNPSLEFSDVVHVSKLQPSVMPDLFKGEQLAVLGRYTGSGSSLIRLTGELNGEKKTYTYEALFPAKAQEYLFLAPLWATRRVGYLLDQIRLHGENKELREEVVELARRYGIVTPYTSYLVLEDESQRNLPPLQRSFAQPAEAEFSKMKGMWNSARADKSGSMAVDGAQAFGQMKEAQGLEAPSAISLGKAATGAGKDESRMSEEQKPRRAGGKTFYRNGKQWVDSQLSKLKNTEPVKIKFNSEEYFALLKNHQEASVWLALGPNVTFVMGNKVYQVEE